jgi:hypothetical protein
MDRRCSDHLINIQASRSREIKEIEEFSNCELERIALPKQIEGNEHCDRINPISKERGSEKG